MHLSYGKYAREGNIKETGNGKKMYVERHKEYETKRVQRAVPELQELFLIRVM